MDFTGIFPSFDKGLVDKLTQIGKLIEFAEGELVMRKGQYIKNTLIILEGTVKLYREGKEGEEFFLYYLEKGEACALSMICATKNEASEIKARALTKVKALAIPIQHMGSLMKNYTNWYYYVLESYRSRFEELLLVVDQIAFNEMDQKLEFYLKRQFHALKKKHSVHHPPSDCGRFEFFKRSNHATTEKA